MTRHTNPLLFDLPNARERFYAAHGVTVPHVLVMIEVPCEFCGARVGERCRISHASPLSLVAHDRRSARWHRRFPKFSPERDAHDAATVAFAEAVAPLVKLPQLPSPTTTTIEGA